MMPNLGVKVSAQRMTMSSLLGGELSTHFVAKSRIDCREERSTCSAYMSSFFVLARRSSTYSTRNGSDGAWCVSRIICAPRDARDSATAAPMPEVPP